MSRNFDLDIALVICPFWGVETPPIGLAYLDESVRAAGLSSKVIDFNLEVYYKQPSERREMWRTTINVTRNVLQRSADLLSSMDDDLEQMVQRLIALNARMIGFSVSLGSLRVTRELLGRLRAAGVRSKLVLGGPFFFDQSQARRVIARQADYIVAGEGEAVLVDALSAMRRGEDPTEVPGLLAISDSGVLRGTGREAPPVIDYPYPRYAGFDVPRYTVGRIDVLSSRGCVRKCRFCNDFRYAGRFRVRPEQSVIEEMRFIRDEHGLLKLMFLDPVFNGDLQRAARLCDKIIEADLGIGWSAQLMVHPGMESADFERMAAAGCTNVDMGLESGVDSVLAAMNKPYTAQQASRMIRGLAAAGISPKVNLIVGYPGESDADFEAGMRFIEDHADALVGVGLLNTCLINSDSYLDLHARELGLLMGRDTWAAATWADRLGNSFELRKRRAQRMLQTLERCGLPVDVNNVLWEIEAEPQVVSRQRILIEGADLLPLPHRLDEAQPPPGPLPQIQSYEIEPGRFTNGAWQCPVGVPLSISVTACDVHPQREVRIGVELWLSGFLVTRLLSPPLSCDKTGRARAGLLIQRLELEPEVYSLSLTLEQREGPRPMLRDARICRDVQVVAQDQAAPTVFHLLRTRHHWRVDPLRAGSCASGPAHIAGVKVENAPSLAGERGETVVTVQVASSEPVADPKLFVEILSNSRGLLRAAGFDLQAYPGHALIPAGGALVELVLPELALGWGAYAVAAGLFADDRRSALLSEASLERPFVVKVRPDRAVEGLVVPPHRWIDAQLPAPATDTPPERFTGDPLKALINDEASLIDASYFDFDLNGVRYFHFESEALIEQRDDRELRLVRRWGAWSSLPRIIESVERVDGRLRWRLAIEAANLDGLQRVKAGLLLDARCTGFELGDEGHDPQQRGPWGVIGPRDDAGRMPLEQCFELTLDAKIPLAARCNGSRVALSPGPDAPALMPVLQSDCDGAWGLSVYAVKPRRVGERLVLLDLLIDCDGVRPS
ncbi:MAG: radical SAM protein [Candidatus Alcyoniella australis]|nr:radical SAM protein [Candidatus Alcyoniella australis]